MPGYSGASPNQPLDERRAGVEPFLVDQRTIAAHLGVHPNTIARAVKARSIPVVHFRGRVLFNVAQVERYLVEQAAASVVNKLDAQVDEPAVRRRRRIVQALPNSSTGFDAQPVARRKAGAK